MTINYTNIRLASYGIFPVAEGATVFIKKKWFRNKYYLHINNRGLFKNHKIGNFSFEEAKIQYLNISKAMFGNDTNDRNNPTEP